MKHALIAVLALLPRVARGDATVRMMGPGTISTGDSESAPAVTPDGNTLYFAKVGALWRQTIVVAHRGRGGVWSTPEVAPFSGRWTDTDPHLSPDGKRLWFTSNRPIDGAASEPRADLDLWYVDRTPAGAWSAPVHPGGAINSAAIESSASVTRDGTLYFEAMRPEHPGTHVYRAALVGGTYGAPELLPFSTAADDRNPVVASDGSFVIFFSSDRGGAGGGDLFVSFHRPDGSWSAAHNLGGAINSADWESTPALSADDKTLYFASNRVDPQPARTHRVTYAELQAELHAPQNGGNNLYEVDISDLHRLDAG